MAKCTFCKTDIPNGTGKMFVKVTGKVLWFCTRKCEKNMLKLKRNPAKYKWASKVKIAKKN
jgi:large subunit ribosomal protein L24e